MIPKLKLFKSDLKASDYEGIVTVFALIMAIEYASGIYDLWDLFIGSLSIYLGAMYWQIALKLNDFLFSLLTTSLVSLGIVTVVFGVVFSVAELCGIEQKPHLIESFWIENLRFLLFGFFVYVFFNRLKSGILHNNELNKINTKSRRHLSKALKRKNSTDS